MNYIITGADATPDVPTGTFDATINTVVLEAAKQRDDGTEVPPRLKIQLVLDDGKHIHWDSILLKETTLWRLSAISRALKLGTMPLAEFIEAIKGKRVRVHISKGDRFVNIKYGPIKGYTTMLTEQPDTTEESDLPF